MSFFRCCPPCYFEAGSHWTWSSLFKVGWRACGPPGSSCVGLPSTRTLTCMHLCLLFICGFWGWNTAVHVCSARTLLSLFLFCICAKDMYMHVSMCECMYLCKCVESRGWYCMSSLSSQLVLGLLLFISQCWDYRQAVIPTYHFCECWDQNSAPHICRTSVLPLSCFPSPWLSFCNIACSLFSPGAQPVEWHCPLSG